MSFSYVNRLVSQMAEINGLHSVVHQLSNRMGDSVSRQVLIQAKAFDKNVLNVAKCAVLFDCSLVSELCQCGFQKISLRSDTICWNFFLKKLEKKG